MHFGFGTAINVNFDCTAVDLLLVLSFVLQLEIAVHVLRSHVWVVYGMVPGPG